MRILIVETANTEDGANIDTILSKHVICRNDADKRRFLPLFKQPTCTKNEMLLTHAEQYEKLFK